LGACLGAAGCELDPIDISSRQPSAEELRRRLLGIWYDCKQSGGLDPFGGDAAGVEFTPEQRWYFLRREAAALVRETGFGRAGTYDIIDTSVMNGPGAFHLNMNLNTGGVMIVSWTLAAQPQLLLVNNSGVQKALYSHVSGAACPTDDDGR
jgi:hypothetical protein